MDADVDLTQENAEIRQAAQAVLDGQVMPWLVDQLQSEWPRRTGTSAEAWRYDGSNLVNSVPYTDDIRSRDGLATDTVLQPLVNQAAQRVWTL